MKNYNIAALEQKPPEDLIQKMWESGYLNKTYLICYTDTYYNLLSGIKEKTEQVYCTGCGETYWRYSVPKQNDIGHCENCHRTGRFKLRSRMRNPIEEKNSALVFNRVDGNKILALSYEVYRYIEKDGSESFERIPMDAYLFGEGKPARFAKWEQWNMGQRYPLDNWDYRERINDLWARSGCFIYPLAEGLLEGTVLQNSHVQDYIAAAVKRNHFPHAMKYCEQYLRYPGIENLLLNKFYEIVQEKLIGSGTINSAVKWRELALSKMLGLDRAEQNRMKWEHWDSAELLGYKIFRDAGLEIEKEDLEILERIRAAKIGKFRLTPLQTVKLCRYIKKKQNKSNAHSLVRYWKDYYEAARAVGYDLSRPEIMFPSKLEDAHDRAVAARKYVEDQALIEKFAKVYENLAPLNFTMDGMCIRPAKSEKELIVEGKILSHCVGGYGEAHCTGRPIFFLRKAGEPDKPWYTLQINTALKQQVQLHGYKNDRNKPIPEEVKAFAAYWIKNIVQQFNFDTGKFKKAKKKSAA